MQYRRVLPVVIETDLEVQLGADPFYDSGTTSPVMDEIHSFSAIDHISGARYLCNLGFRQVPDDGFHAGEYNGRNAGHVQVIRKTELLVIAFRCLWDLF